METKFTKDYILLIDEKAEIKEGDYILSLINNPSIIDIVTESDEGAINGKLIKWTNRKHCVKITAYYPLNSEAKELDLPLLPPFEEDNIEKLADNYAVDTQKVHPADSFIAKQSYIEGYKAAQQSNKQFSLEDMKKAIEMAREGNFSKYYGCMGWVNSEEDIIQSLSTQQLPKEFIPEYETPYTDAYTEDRMRRFYGKPILKTITNIEGKQELVGRYKY